MGHAIKIGLFAALAYFCTGRAVSDILLQTQMAVDYSKNNVTFESPYSFQANDAGKSEGRILQYGAGSPYDDSDTPFPPRGGYSLPELIVNWTYDVLYSIDYKTVFMLTLSIAENGNKQIEYLPVRKQMLMYYGAISLQIFRGGQYLFTQLSNPWNEITVIPLEGTGSKPDVTKSQEQDEGHSAEGVSSGDEGISANAKESNDDRRDDDEEREHSYRHNDACAICNRDSCRICPCDKCQLTALIDGTVDEGVPVSELLRSIREAIENNHACNHEYVSAYSEVSSEECSAMGESSTCNSNDDQAVWVTEGDYGVESEIVIEDDDFPPADAAVECSYQDDTVDCAPSYRSATISGSSSNSRAGIRKPKPRDLILQQLSEVEQLIDSDKRSEAGERFVEIIRGMKDKLLYSAVLKAINRTVGGSFAIKVSDDASSVRQALLCICGTTGKHKDVKFRLNKVVSLIEKELHEAVFLLKELIGEYLPFEYGIVVVNLNKYKIPVIRGSSKEEIPWTIKSVHEFMGSKNAESHRNRIGVSLFKQIKEALAQENTQLAEKRLQNYLSEREGMSVYDTLRFLNGAGIPVILDGDVHNELVWKPCIVVRAMGKSCDEMNEHESLKDINLAYQLGDMEAFNLKLKRYMAVRETKNVSNTVFMLNKANIPVCVNGEIKQGERWTNGYYCLAAGKKLQKGLIKPKMIKQAGEAKAKEYLKEFIEERSDMSDGTLASTLNKRGVQVLLSPEEERWTAVLVKEAKAKLGVKKASAEAKASSSSERVVDTNISINPPKKKEGKKRKLPPRDKTNEEQPPTTKKRKK